jgi:hypothetical protein
MKVKGYFLHSCSSKIINTKLNIYLSTEESKNPGFIFTLHPGECRTAREFHESGPQTAQDRPGEEKSEGYAMRGAVES